MPYGVHKRGNNWVTINTETGEVKGKHDSREKAMKQMRLLYMVEHGGTPREQKKQMPIFEFVCHNCGKRFEVVNYSMKDIVDYTRCPECNKLAKRILSPFSFRMGTKGKEEC